MKSNSTRFKRSLAIFGVVVVAATAVLGSQSAVAAKKINIAYLSFAITNSYDAPMLAAAKAVAATYGAKVTVFDANNNPATQQAQLANIIASRKYQGIITQPIYGAGLVPLVKKAIAAGIKVVNIDQILGLDYTTDKPQVKGLSGNVVFLPSKIGTQLGQQTIAACASKNLNPCNIAYLYSIKASTLDVAIYDGFSTAIAGTPSIKIVAEGQSFFTPSIALGAVQNILQANPDLNLVVGSDQGIQGAVQALDGAKVTGVLLVGFGGSGVGIAGVKAGTWFSTIFQAPATEGQLGMQALITAIKTGKAAGGINPLKGLPNGGVVNKGNAAKFTAEWPG